MTVELLYVMYTKNSTGNLRRAKELASRVRLEDGENIRFHKPEFLEVKKLGETSIELLHEVTVVATLEETDSDAAIEQAKRLVEQAGTSMPEQTEIVDMEYEHAKYIEK